MRVDVFFYGLFMDIETLRSMGTKPGEPRVGRVMGFALRLGERATLTPEPASVVHGVVIDLSHEEIERLYSGPGLAAYRPETVTVELRDGRHLSALCFVLPPATPPGPINDDYAQKLRELARRVGLPPGYVASIR